MDDNYKVEDIEFPLFKRILISVIGQIPPSQWDRLESIEETQDGEYRTLQVKMKGPASTWKLEFDGSSTQPVYSKNDGFMEVILLEPGNGRWRMRVGDANSEEKLIAGLIVNYTGTQ